MRKLGKQADEYEVRRANLEMAAEQRVAARQRQCEAEMERQVERASAAEAHAQHVSAQLEAAHARAAAEREGHARAQERLELQLAQCRERLVSRTEQLLTLETMEEGGGARGRTGRRERRGGADRAGAAPGYLGAGVG